MAEHLTIRRGVAGDAEAVSALLLEVWHDTYDRLFGAEKVADISRQWHSAEVLGQQIAAPDHLFLVAAQSTGLCGHAYAFVGEDGEFQLSRIYVRPEAQGKGLGKALLDKVVAGFPNTSKITLEVHEKQFSAHRFYLANGFAIVGDTAHCGAASDIPALIMERKLSA